MFDICPDNKTIMMCKKDKQDQNLTIKWYNFGQKKILEEIVLNVPSPVFLKMYPYDDVNWALLFYPDKIRLYWPGEDKISNIIDIGAEMVTFNHLEGYFAIVE